VSTPNDRSAHDPAARYAPDPAEARRVSRFNKVARVLTSPLHPLLSRRLMLISVTGRKTGAIYTTPVAYAADGGHLLIAAGGRWRHNLATEPEVTVVLRGETVHYRASVTRDDEYEAQLATMAVLNPTWARYTAIELGPDGGLPAPRSPGHVPAGSCWPPWHPPGRDARNVTHDPSGPGQPPGAAEPAAPSPGPMLHAPIGEFSAGPSPGGSS
jgi:deazaflavin-dependent oxidoreductase (nitroreductase family)